MTILTPETLSNVATQLRNAGSVEATHVAEFIEMMPDFDYADGIVDGIELANAVDALAELQDWAASAIVRLIAKGS
jgi:hypothetical protein